MEYGDNTETVIAGSSTPPYPSIFLPRVIDGGKKEKKMKILQPGSTEGGFPRDEMQTSIEGEH